MSSMLLFSCDDDQPDSRNGANSNSGGVFTVELPNRLIRASAGTGKTYQLTSRFLQLILLGATPESILATTFTRKAAGEILERVMVRLARACLDSRELRSLAEATELPQLAVEDCRAKLQLVTRQIHRLRISTIDAFFTQIAMGLSLELGLVPGWRVADEFERERLVQEAIDDVLSREAISETRTLLHQITPKGIATRSLTSLMSSSVKSAYHLFVDALSSAWTFNDIPKPLSKAEIERLITEIGQVSLAGLDSRVQTSRDNELAQMQNEDWLALATSDKGLIAKVIAEGQDATYYAKPIPEQLLGLYQQLIPHLKAQFLISMQTQQKATAEFLGKFDEHFRRHKFDARLVEFSDVTRALARHSQANDLQRIAFRIDAGIEHLLLDEFQDTSTEQWLALQQLARRCAANEPGRSFFCVGDTKQAIYGWRGGNTGVFDLVEQLEHLEATELQASRRSAPPVIEAVNQVFETMASWQEFKRAKRAAKRWNFPRHTTVLEHMPGYVSLETCDAAVGELANASDALRIQYYTAVKIKELVERDPGRSIGVLCRDNNSVARILALLLRQGTQASGEGGNSPTDAASVELILSLLTLADHPSDTISAYHLASSPWGPALGLELIRHEEGRLRIPATLDEKPTSSRRFPLDLRAMGRLAERVRQQLYDQGYGVTLQTYAEQLRPYCNHREIRRLDQLVELAFTYQGQLEQSRQFAFDRQHRVSTRPSSFVKSVRKSRVVNPSADDVRIMTIHQSKGLQFDIVLLPDLLGPFVRGTPQFVSGRKTLLDPIEWIAKYVGQSKGRQLLPEPYRPLFELHDDSIAQDSICLLYVAMTRAVHALHIIAPDKKAPSKESPIGLVMSKLAPDVPLEPRKQLFELGDPFWYQQVPPKRPVPLPSTSADIEEPGAVSISEQSELSAKTMTLHPRLAPRSRSARRHWEVVTPSSLTNRVRRPPGSNEATNHAIRQWGLVLHDWFSHITWLERDAAGQFTHLPQESLLQERAQSHGCNLGDLLRKKGTVHQRIDPPHALTEVLRHALEHSAAEQVFIERDYWSRLLSTWPELADIREKVSLEVRTEISLAARDGNQMLTGQLDRLILIRHDDQLWGADIVDFKTEQPHDVASAERVTGSVSQDLLAERQARYEPQLDAYRRLVSQALRLPPTRIGSQLIFLTQD